MKKLFGVILVVLSLVAICICEQLMVDTSINYLNEQSLVLYNLSTNTENVNTEEIIEKTYQLKDYWKEKESMLCFFINYKDMSEMSNEIVRMTSYAQDNIKEEYLASLRLVLYYCETFDHITGFSFNNIF